MKNCIILVLLIFPLVSLSQSLNIKNNQGGILSFGVRSTISTFNDNDFGNNGFGAGGQFRIQLADRLNTEWYTDYITGNVSDYASRTDFHIGWSVMAYFTNKLTPLIKPYVLAGQCFDYTRIEENINPNNFGTKFSAAVQGGVGCHINLSERIDISIASQYMIHLGEDLHSHRHEDGTIEFEKEKGTDLEGHLLFHIGLNYKIIDIWGKEK
jgi:hypothetical protein